MANLLRKQTKHQQLLKRAARYAIAFAVITSIALGIFSVALLPLYIQTYVVTTFGRENAPEVTTDFGSLRQELIRTLRADAELVERMHAVSVQSDITEAIVAAGEYIVAAPAKVNSFVVSTNEAGEYHLTIAGVATSRPAVVAVQQALQESVRLELNEFPVSNFTPAAGEYTFTAKLTIPVQQTQNYE